MINFNNFRTQLVKNLLKAGSENSIAWRRSLLP